MTSLENLETDRLKEIRERAEKATKGPWSEGVDGNIRVYGPDGQGEHSGLIAVVYKGRANASFIRHARADIPYLLEQLAKSQSEREAAERETRMGASEVDVGQVAKKVARAAVEAHKNLADWELAAVTELRKHIAQPASPKLDNRTIVNSTVIHVWIDEETKLTLAEFPKIIVGGKTEADAIESLKTIVRMTSHMFNTGEFPPDVKLGPPQPEQEERRDG